MSTVAVALLIVANSSVITDQTEFATSLPGPVVVVFYRDSRTVQNPSLWTDCVLFVISRLDLTDRTGLSYYWSSCQVRLINH